MRHRRDHLESIGFFRRLKLATQVRACLLLISVLPLTVAGIVTYRDSVSRLQSTTIERLSVVAESRAHYIELYLHERIKDIAVLSHAPGIPEAMAAFVRTSRAHGLGSPEYAAVEREVRPFLTNFQTIYGYTNILLLSHSGDTLFSVSSREESASNGEAGPGRDSALERVFDRVKTRLGTEVTDYEPDVTGKPAAFIAAPVFQDGAFIGAVALELSNHEVYALAQDYSGLGESGEIVLVTRRAEGLAFIAPTRHDPHAEFLKKLPMGADRYSSLQQATLGKTGSGLYVDYRGVPVIAAWRFVPGFRWGMMVKIDARETLAPAREFRDRSIVIVATLACALLVIASFVTKAIAGPRDRFETALEERTRLAELSADVGMALTREATLQAMLGRCVEHLVEHLGAAVARIWTLNPAGDVLELQASAGLYTHLDGPHSRVPVGQFKIGLIASERQPHLTNAVIGDPRVGDQEWARREGMTAFAGYPLLVDDQLVGVMALFSRRPLSDNVFQAMSSVAVWISLAIERFRAAERLSYQATHDALTGLTNFNMYQQNLARNVESARANKASFALIMIDLDRFKEINDTFGHHYGNAVLQQVGTRLRDAFRKSDMVSRLGGDEFGAILPGADCAGAVVAANKVLDTLRQPIVIEGREVDVGVSIGIAIYPEHGEDTITLMRRADVAMYAAKRVHAGYAVSSSDQSANIPSRLSLISDLRHGIEHQQLSMYYQPKVDLKTMRVGSVEALVRWLHPREGMIPPSRFIPLAEATGLINPLSHWVINRALSQWRTWHQAGLNLNIAVNLAPDNLQDPQLIGALVKMLESPDATPSWLTLEITEGAMMTDPARTRGILQRLHEMGVRIAIDDFGTGYSSLAYLKTLPVDEVKIDRCFVKDMISDKRDACIVRSVIDLGHNLGLQVVAEGVEDQASLELLASWGCDLAQGFYFSRPLAPTDFVIWMNRFTGEQPNFQMTNRCDPAQGVLNPSDRTRPPPLLCID